MSDTLGNPLKTSQGSEEMYKKTDKQQTQK